LFARCFRKTRRPGERCGDFPPISQHDMDAVVVTRTSTAAALIMRVPFDCRAGKARSACPPSHPCGGHGASHLCPPYGKLVITHPAIPRWQTPPSPE
jgi:hypothetical protein